MSNSILNKSVMTELKPLAPDSVTIQQQIQALNEQSGPTACLSNLPKLLRRFNIDQTTFNNIITITGTNGKGSTIVLLEHLFESNNCSVISHSSPHLRAFNERIRINGHPITDQQLLTTLQTIQTTIPDYHLSFYMVSFLVFCLTANKQIPDYLLIEVGIGGRLDPANFFDASIAAITNIGLDHIEQLGPTLDDIAWEKAHIARENRPIILGQKIPDQGMDYLTQLGAIPVKAIIDDHMDFSHLTAPPRTSLMVAYTIYQQLNQWGHQLEQPLNWDKTVIPGRRHVLNQPPLLIADVAHNAPAIDYLFNHLKQTLPAGKQQWAGLFTAMKTRNIATLLPPSITQYIDQWHLVELANQDPRLYSLEALCEQFDALGLPYQAHATTKDALKAIEQQNTTTIAFGSFVLIGDILDQYHA